MSTPGRTAAIRLLVILTSVCYRTHLDGLVSVLRNSIEESMHAARTGLRLKLATILFLALSLPASSADAGLQSILILFAKYDEFEQSDSPRLFVSPLAGND